MKNSEINIRDPFVLFENGKNYMYGTRAKNFGTKTGGFDVHLHLCREYHKAQA